eukprot:jgi/Botrbrau1/940/Bobra.0167s0051.1
MGKAYGPNEDAQGKVASTRRRAQRSDEVMKCMESGSDETFRALFITMSQRKNKMVKSKCVFAFPARLNDSSAFASSASLLGAYYNANNNYNDKCQTSTHRCCAERRLLELWTAEAKRHGVRAHSLVTWVRRKLGSDITVWRCRSDGSLGCATPCLLCRRELLRFDLRVHCPLDNGTWFRGRMDENNAPLPALTSGQRRQLNVNGPPRR